MAAALTLMSVSLTFLVDSFIDWVRWPGLTVGVCVITSIAFAWLLFGQTRNGVVAK